jgi:hypothetical protein
MPWTSINIICSVQKKNKYPLHPHIFDVYSTNRKDPKCLTSSLISVQTLSALTNLPFFLIILSFRGTDRVAAIAGPVDPPPVRGTGGGAAVGRGAARIRCCRGAREEEPPSAGADDGISIPRQARRRARLLLAPARIFSLR